MSSQKLLLQLVGRVATLEYFAAHTIVVALVDHPKPFEVLAILEEHFDGALEDIEAISSEAGSAGAAAAERILSQARTELS